MLSNATKEYRLIQYAIISFIQIRFCMYSLTEMEISAIAVLGDKTRPLTHDPVLILIIPVFPGINIVALFPVDCL
jgi:hypothetical protein